MSNSPEERRKYIGSSDIGAIMGVSPYKSKRELWLEKVGLVKAEDISLQPQIIMGQELESVIREKLEAKYETKFPSKTFTINNWRAQCDGYSEDKLLIVEIKTVGKERFEEAKRGEIPEVYKLQIQWQLFLSGASKAVYAAFYVKDDELATVDVLPDEPLWEKLKEAADHFWNCVVNNEEPDEYLLDQSAKETVRQWALAKVAFDEAKAKFEELDEALKGFLEDRKIDGLEWRGFKAISVERVGSVNYKSIKELEGVDLEKYRAKPSKFYKLSVKGDL